MTKTGPRFDTVVGVAAFFQSMFGVVKIKFDPPSIDPRFVKVLALLLGIGGPETGTGKGTGNELVRCWAWHPPMTNDGDNTVPCNVTFTGSSFRTGETLPRAGGGGLIAGVAK